MKNNHNLLKLGSKVGLYKYNSEQDFYSMVLNALRGEYPEGKIDFMRFLMDWTRLPSAKIAEIMEVIFNYLDMGPTTMNSTLVILNWKDPYEVRVKLSHLISVLCYCVNNKDCFNGEEFNKAFEHFYIKAYPNANHN